MPTSATDKPAEIPALEPAELLRREEHYFSSCPVSSQSTDLPNARSAWRAAYSLALRCFLEVGLIENQAI